MALRDDAQSPEFGRGLSFTDAIYGFAITLLVVNLDVPEAADWTNLSTLIASGLLGQLYGFTLSFLVIALYWHINFRLVRTLSGMTTAVLALQIVGAFFIVLVPFTTQGISDPDTRDFGLPVALYALVIALASIAQTAMYVTAQRQGLTGLSRGSDVSRALILGALASPVIFLVSIPVALTFGALAGQLVWLALIVAGPLVGRLSPVLPNRPAA